MEAGYAGVERRVLFPNKSEFIQDLFPGLKAEEDICGLNDFGRFDLILVGTVFVAVPGGIVFADFLDQCTYFVVIIQLLKLVKDLFIHDYILTQTTGRKDI